MGKINAEQGIQIDRLRLGSFNGMIGDYIADSLLRYTELWDSFLFGRFEYASLIELRDLSKGFINADTIMILTDKARWPKLLEQIEQWGADEVGYTGGDGKVWETAPYRNAEEASLALGGGFSKDQILVRIWWD